MSLYSRFGQQTSPPEKDCVHIFPEDSVMRGLSRGKEQFLRNGLFEAHEGMDHDKLPSILERKKETTVYSGYFIASYVAV